MAKTNLFLLEDHQLVREGLKGILEQDNDFLVIGEMGDPLLFLKTLRGLNIDLLLCDISLPHMSGLDVVKEALKIKPSLKVIMLSMHDSPEYIIRARKEGAKGFISKSLDASKMVEAIKKVQRGLTYFEENLPQEVFEPSTSPLLSQREKEILKMISSGLSSKEIAHSLKLSPRTVEAHRFNTMKKLNTSNMTETIALAIQLKLL